LLDGVRVIDKEEAMKMKKVAGVVALLALAACGSETPTVATPVPIVAGKYNGWPTWTVQWLRARDGVTGTFTCEGSITLSQGAAVPGGATLTGFAVASYPCPPQSFELTGTVDPDGSITLRTNGPKPPEGQCPAATDVVYSGVVRGNELSARATTNINCPGPGEGPQRMDYILSAYRNE